MLKEAKEVWIEDLRAAVVGSHDVQQPPASLTAVPGSTQGSRHRWLRDGHRIQDWSVKVQIQTGQHLCLEPSWLVRE